MPTQSEIEEKRKELLYIAKRTGLSSTDTLRCSKELDELIIIYQQSLLNGKFRN
ncbi:aspartyl-phosphate phosphatase Spo0E family protein [Evansella cellulosilytica]|uniref:Sporulation stage 0, Spo0E-like regulatory phosphatase n=1 Tax=Evansella cellulosilytica (strain ATCC 21833 / DSM 2522 / FERM P-1141 / JCM 9156 / N-4) TaxID=649639 RepID=E6U092_EVAC2|nr:aspartyl-phosphate phosphatase Spo0E family protein [Evansella cellulosilytica]ADU30208.1 Sporulation stage 0, Spo0E-like regulatory phosphatase [Evansella cellulosilytica DSM 2522]